ncbi:hypothetical protein MWG04_10625, partial [Fusobacterium necrophorum]|nr:hypothetical protein [Fusobacterium necrophorum]MDK4519281.1 hypothetical protein [Fusobacterium necrophorum]
KSFFSEIDFKIIILKLLENRHIAIKEKIEIEVLKNLSRLENLARNQGGEKMIIVHFYNNTEKVYSVYANSLEDVKENPK